jgi:hypothetical protein
VRMTNLVPAQVRHRISIDEIAEPSHAVSEAIARVFRFTY